MDLPITKRKYGWADEVLHAHKELVPTRYVKNGNTEVGAPKSQTFNDANTHILGEMPDVADLVHIPLNSSSTAVDELNLLIKQIAAGR
jgi:hypothetical protein